MENLNVNINPELIYYPVVDFNYETGICEISGESYMEGTYKFYEPLIDWLKNYISENKPIVFNIRLTYFNTSSSKFLLEILDILKGYSDKEGKVTVNWFYKAEDPDMLNEISDFIEETGIAINIMLFAPDNFN